MKVRLENFVSITQEGPEDTVVREEIDTQSQARDDSFYNILQIHSVDLRSIAS